MSPFLPSGQVVCQQLEEGAGGCGEESDSPIVVRDVSVEHYFATDEVVPWWGFADIGKEMIRLNNTKL